MVELVLNLRARPTGIPAMVRALTQLRVQGEWERGCAGCWLYTDTAKPESLHYVERWSTSREFEVQLRSPRFGTLLSLMETAREAPDLEVRTVSEQRGLEYVRAVRLAGGGPAREV